MARISHVMNVGRTQASIKSLAKSLDADFPLAVEGEKGRIKAPGEKDVMIVWDSKSVNARNRIVRKLQQLQNDMVNLSRDLRFEEPKRAKDTAKKKRSGRRSIK